MNENETCPNCGEYHSCTDLIREQQAQIDTYKSQNSSQIDAYRYETMLRQQQAEIDKVNAEWAQAAMALGKCVQENHELKSEIEALKIKHDAIACSSCACGFIKRGKTQEK